MCHSNDGKKSAVYISLSHAREKNLQDLKNILLPRGNGLQIIQDLPKPQSLDEISFIVLPIPHNFDYNLPLFTNENSSPLPAPALNSVSSIDVEICNLPSKDPSEVQYVRYKDYRDRLLTYTTWGERLPKAEYLSQAGFFYTGIADKVRCFSCGIGFKDFAKSMKPIEEHVKHSDQCSYLRIFLGETKLEEYKRYLRHQDPEYHRKSQSLEAGRRIRHPDYQTPEARVASFRKWPLDFNVHVIANTGLYYTGYGAVVRCFACDGGFRLLKTLDDLWLDHCFFFPPCPHMETKIGKRFIKLLQETVLDIEAEEDKDIGAVGGQTNDNTSSGKIASQLKGDQKFDIDDVFEQLFTNDRRLEENEKLRKIVHCSKCGDQINAVMLPCGHREYCMKCAKELKCCPKCERPVTLIETFM